MSKAEKFIEDCTRNCSNIVVYSGMSEGSELRYHEWLSPDEAKKAVEIAREEIYEWLLANADDYCFCARNFEARRCIYDIKQAMKGE